MDLIDVQHLFIIMGCTLSIAAFLACKLRISRRKTAKDPAMLIACILWAMTGVVLLSGTVLYIVAAGLEHKSPMLSPDLVWALLAPSSFLFALILGFRINRRSDRIRREDELLLGLFRDAEHLQKQGLLEGGFFENLASIDTCSTQEINGIYRDLCTEIKQAGKAPATLTDDSPSTLRSVQEKLDRFAHSRLGGQDIPEVVILAVLGIGMACFLLFSYASFTGDSDYSPDDNFWIGEFILIYTAAIVVLLGWLLLLSRSDRVSLIAVDPDDGGWHIAARSREPSERSLCRLLVLGLVAFVLVSAILYRATRAGVQEEPSSLAADIDLECTGLADAALDDKDEQDGDRPFLPIPHELWKRIVGSDCECLVAVTLDYRKVPGDDAEGWLTWHGEGRWAWPSCADGSVGVTIREVDNEHS